MANQGSIPFSDDDLDDIVELTAKDRVYRDYNHFIVESDEERTEDLMPIEVAVEFFPNIY
jgi:hypothetical protein